MPVAEGDGRKGRGGEADGDLLFNGCRVPIERLRTSRDDEGDNCPTV